MECTKCGIMLCEKNYIISQNKYIKKNCKPCEYNNNYSKYRFENKELNNIAKRNYENYYMRFWKKNNRANVNSYYKYDSVKQKIKRAQSRDNLTNEYVKGRLNRMGIVRNIITLELIEVKRNQLILKRWLRQTSS